MCGGHAQCDAKKKGGGGVVVGIWRMHGVRGARDPVVVIDDGGID